MNLLGVNFGSPPKKPVTEKPLTEDAIKAVESQAQATANKADLEKKMATATQKAADEAQRLFEAQQERSRADANLRAAKQGKYIKDGE